MTAEPETLPLFAAYPTTPGYQDTDTSREAAEKVKPKAAWVRARVIDCLTRQGPMTTVQIAAALGMAYETVQPRTSEARAQGLIVDTGRRGPSRDPGKSSIVWAIVTTESVVTPCEDAA
jgi:predicted transcriptional regulator